MTREQLKDALEKKLMLVVDRLVSAESAKLEQLMEQAVLNALAAEVQAQASRVVSGVFTTRVGFSANGRRRRRG